MYRTRGATDEEAAQHWMHVELQSVAANRAAKSCELLLAAASQQATEDGVVLSPSLAIRVRNLDVPWMRHFEMCYAAQRRSARTARLSAAE